MVTVFRVPSVNSGWNKAIRNCNFFHEYVHQMSRNSSSHKISVGPGSSNVVSLAVLSSLTFFSVSSNVEYDTNHTVLLNFKWFLGGEIQSVWWFNLVRLICGDEERLIFKFLNGFFFLIWTNRAQSLYLVTVFPSSVHRFFF